MRLAGLAAAMRSLVVLALLLLPVANGQTRRVKVQHIAPFVGRHGGGLLLNVTGKGMQLLRSNLEVIGRLAR